MHLMKKFNWPNTLFLTIVPAIAIVGTTLIIMKGALHWQTLVLAFVYIIFTGMAVTGGYHRLFSHLSYKAHPIVRLFYLLFGAAAFEGSALEWCTDHRNHHRYTDTDRDPYDIKKGFWFAHMGWLFHLDTSKRDYSNVDDLKQDPLVAWQHRHVVLIGTFVSFIMPMLIAMLWGDPWGGLIIAGALRITVNQQFTFCINSVCHLWGKRSYSEGQSARDNWVTALFTYGEGFHNFHHQFPLDYRNGIRYFHFDPTKWLIRSLSYLGLAYDLKQVSIAKIVQYKLRVDENRLKSLNLTDSFSDYVKNSIDPLRESLMQVLARVEELEKSYRELKQQGIDSMMGKVEEYRQRLSEQRARLYEARSELRQGLSQWSRLVKVIK